MISKEITREKLDKYLSITSEAFEIIKKSIIVGREKDAKEIIEMVGNYISDAKHFEEKGEWVLAYGALNYAHGWIDSGVRLGIFEVGSGNNKLFTIR